MERRPTGRGCSRCGRTCGSRRPSCCAPSSARARSSWLRSCPSCARCSPGCPSRPPWTRTWRGSACSARPLSSCATHARLGRRCSSWTICTPPIRRRSCCCRFLARELGSIHLLVLGAYRDVDPVPGQPLSETLVEVAREPRQPSPLTRRPERSRGDAVCRVHCAGDCVAASSRAPLHEQTEGQSAVRRGDVAPPRARGHRAGFGRWGLRLAIPRTVRERDRPPTHSPLAGLQPRAAARVGSGQGVRPRRARPAARPSRWTSCSTSWTRRSPPASCQTFRAAPVVFASPTCSSATRSTTGSPPHGASGCTGARLRRSRSCTAIRWRVTRRRRSASWLWRGIGHRPACPRARSTTTGAAASWPCACLPTTRPPRR